MVTYLLGRLLQARSFVSSTSDRLSAPQTCIPRSHLLCPVFSGPQRFCGSCVVFFSLSIGVTAPPRLIRHVFRGKLSKCFFDLFLVLETLEDCL